MSVTKDMLIARGVADLSLRNRDIAKSWHNTRSFVVGDSSSSACLPVPLITAVHPNDLERAFQ